MQPHIIPWYSRPEAQTLLLSCAANPPVVRSFVKRYVTTRDEWREYTGPRVRKLAAIRSRAWYEAEAHALTLPSDQYCPTMAAMAFDVTVDMAIDAVQRDGMRATEFIELPVIRFEAVRMQEAAE